MAGKAACQRPHNIAGWPCNTVACSAISFTTLSVVRWCLLPVESVTQQHVLLWP